MKFYIIFINLLPFPNSMHKNKTYLMLFVFFLFTMNIVSAKEDLNLWKTHYQIIIVNNDSSDHIQEPVIIDVSSLNCSYNTKEDLMIVHDETVSVPFQWIDESHDKIVILANSSTDSPSYDYTLHCNNPKAGDTSTIIFSVFENFDSRNVLETDWIPSSRGSIYIEDGLLVFSDSGFGWVSVQIEKTIPQKGFFATRFRRIGTGSEWECVMRVGYPSPSREWVIGTGDTCHPSVQIKSEYEGDTLTECSDITSRSGQWINIFAKIDQNASTVTAWADSSLIATFPINNRLFVPVHLSRGSASCEYDYFYHSPNFFFSIYDIPSQASVSLLEKPATNLFTRFFFGEAADKSFSNVFFHTLIYVLVIIILVLLIYILIKVALLTTPLSRKLRKK